MAQPVHSAPLMKSAGKYPAALTLLETESDFRGQKAMQTSHPLHITWSISM